MVGLVALGLIGGILGGFVGGGGAFVMVPGMMSLGGEGLASVGSNLLHRLGRMTTSARRRAALRRVDWKLLVLLAIPSVAGVEVGRLASAVLRARLGPAAADLYISVVVIVVLAAVARMLVRDLLSSRRRPPAASRLSLKGVMQHLRPLHVPPVIRFPVSSVVVSLWLVLGIGFAAGWFGGTIALGGFLTVPAMIYLLGAPASAAIATDLALVLIIGVYGTVSFAARGHVDLRATLLLYFGSIVGFQLGMLGTRLVREVPVRVVTCVVIGLVVVSRLLALPLVGAAGGWFALGGGTRTALHVASLVALFAGGALLVVMVVGAVVRAVWDGAAHDAYGAVGGEED
ncbi:MAG: sulfite exporter TauE/SafE family protein [Deltaproteobacteria bacterium]|nr:sulfite exporter TauE/SafE family protein [Deltaproteobacteria bacterium]